MAGCRAGNKVGPAPYNSPLWVCVKVVSWSPWELCRFDALRGIGFECALSSVIFLLVFYKQKRTSNKLGQKVRHFD